MKYFMSDDGITYKTLYRDGKYLYLIPSDDSHYDLPIQIGFCNFGFYADNKGNRYKKLS